MIHSIDLTSDGLKRTPVWAGSVLEVLSEGFSMTVLCCSSRLSAMISSSFLSDSRNGMCDAASSSGRYTGVVIRGSGIHKEKYVCLSVRH